jgi:hypothetical protein
LAAIVQGTRPLLPTIEPDFQLSMGDFFGSAYEVDVQSRFARTVQHAGDQEDLPVIQRDAKLPAVRPNEDVVHRAVP